LASRAAPKRHLSGGNSKATYRQNSTWASLRAKKKKIKKKSIFLKQNLRPS
jgi:hypothetical protein